MQLSPLWPLTGRSQFLCILCPEAQKCPLCTTCGSTRAEHRGRITFLSSLAMIFFIQLWVLLATFYCKVTLLVCVLLITQKDFSAKILSSWLDPSLHWWDCSSLTPCWTWWGFCQPISSVCWDLPEWQHNPHVFQTLLTISHHLLTCWGCTLSYYLLS